MALSLLPTFSAYTSVVYLNNNKPLFDVLHLQSDTKLENIKLTVSYFPDYVEPQEFPIPELYPAEPLCIKSNKPDYDLSRIMAITEEEPGQMTFTLTCNGEVLHKQSFNFIWLPSNAWVTDKYCAHPELLAALVQPNDPAVDRILHNAGKLLAEDGKSPSWSGYTKDANDIINKLKAIWAVLKSYNINYALPPESNIDIVNGIRQKIRTPSQIIQGGCATCLDSTMLMAAVMGQAQFNPIVIIVDGHAFIGVMHENETLSKPVTSSISQLQYLAEQNKLILLETTALTRGKDISFEEACEIGKNNLKGMPLHYALDIRQIWNIGIKSLQQHTEHEDIPPAIDDQTAEPQKPEFLPEKTAEELEEEQSLVTARKRTRMENWQLKLLDLSMRNNLLNSKTDKAQLKLILDNPAKLEDELAHGKSFHLKGIEPIMPLKEAIKQDNQEEINRIIHEQVTTAYNKGTLIALPHNNNIDGNDLEKKIYKLYLAARKDMEESGYNTLYIACGFLKWVRRDKGKQTLMAPLLLIPVRLTRKTVKSGFRLQTTDEDPRINLTLLELLKTEYNIRIPELEGELPTDASGLDVAGIFNIVRRAIKDFDGWEVSDLCTLGIFSFAKYLMWKDMCDREAELKANPIVSHLAADERAPFPVQVGFPQPSTLDNEANAAEVYTPLSSDSSQLSAILAAGRGKNFVLIGPPGTGKSQTIANMIAHCLGHGKTVLFVAEKSAALTVVYNRLKRIGLGDICLELHSNKAVKKDVIAQFKASLDALEQPEKKSTWARSVSSMLQVRFGLNLMPWELHHLYPDGTSLYEDICLLAEAPEMPQLPPPSDNILAISAEEKAATTELTYELCNHFAPVAHLFPGVADVIRAAHYSMQWEDDLAELLPRFSRAAERREAAMKALMNELNLSEYEFAGKQAQLIRLFILAARTYGQNNTPLLPSTAADAMKSLQELARQATEYRLCRENLSLPYPENLEEEPDIPRLYTEWREAQFSNFISRFFTNRRIRKALQILAFSRKTPDVGTDLERLMTMRRLKETSEMKDTSLSHFRKGTKTQQGDVDAAQAIADELNTIPDVQPLCYKYLTAEANPFAPGSTAASHITTLKTCAEEYDKLASELTILLGCSISHFESNSNAAQKANELLAIRREWRQVVLWNECAAKAANPMTKAVVEKLKSRELTPDNAEDAVSINFSRSRLRAAVDASNTLTRFSAPTHEQQITDFRKKDEKLLTSAGLHLQNLLRTQALGHTHYAKELAELQHEIGKQRAHKAIRKLLSLTPNVSRMLKPCMLMSPLSVAQYLTPEDQPFDVVIFDEASQIPVWDAIGAIARGKSAVIVGDPRQMPPTSFFSRGKTSEGDEEDDEVEVDLESILDECLACGIPQMNLTWHYRSKSESLIAYSNRNYYENKLVTFPAPVAKDTALQYHYVEGTYERGSSKRYNKKEAKALVDNVLAVLRSPGFEYNEMTSIGIVTFNTQQQALILDLFEKARSEDDSLEPFFDEENPEAIFVKNLENVQGDERGVIYFSTTYGPDEKGNISMNFGPLNQTGGERRLNVAITRARTGMRVFSSMKPEDIDLNRTRARGAKDLRGFLECARMGANAYFNNTTATGKAAESGLQRAICTALAQRGWKCVSNLGVSGFRVDIAIAHPHQPGNMLAGIVLDGPGYAGAATARDRDVLRESVLQSLGWKLCHIWALDWWRDPKGYADTIHGQLNSILKAAK